MDVHQSTRRVGTIEFRGDSWHESLPCHDEFDVRLEKVYCCRRRLRVPRLLTMSENRRGNV